MLWGIETFLGIGPQVLVLRVKVLLQSVESGVPTKVKAICNVKERAVGDGVVVIFGLEQLMSGKIKSLISRWARPQMVVVSLTQEGHTANILPSSQSVIQ